MKTSLSALHHQAIDWQRELDFYTEEIGILSGRLKKIQELSFDEATTKQFKDFEKQFASLTTQIEGLKKDVAVREGVIENMTEETMGGDDTVNTIEDVILKQMKDLSHEIADTRFFFNLFLSKL
jgi:predicted  nucleic acid-binding Zn-ribbon protein